MGVLLALQLLLEKSHAAQQERIGGQCRNCSCSYARRLADQKGPQDGELLHLLLGWSVLLQRRRLIEG